MSPEGSASAGHSFGGALTKFFALVSVELVVLQVSADLVAARASRSVKRSCAPAIDLCAHHAKRPPRCLESLLKWLGNDGAD